VFTQHAAAHRNTLQHTVTHCDTLHTVTHYHNIALTLQYTDSLDTLPPPHTQAGWRGTGSLLYLCICALSFDPFIKYEGRKDMYVNIYVFVCIYHNIYIHVYDYKILHIYIYMV